ncbi:MAG: hypothetical protein LAN84_04165 [Acidobacteriia bacterium]|nr:hypothetical protein [Terriglobia bacterium]
MKKPRKRIPGQEKEPGQITGTHRLLPAAEEHAAKINALLCRAFEVEKQECVLPPKTAPLSFVLENSNREIDMACMGRIGTFGIFTPLADPANFDARIMAENLTLFLEAVEGDLRKHNACGMVVMIPYSLAALGEHLMKIGFATENALKLYWRYFPESTASGSPSSVKPS